MSDLELSIRWLIRRDMPEVLEIENQCFEYVWSEEDFLCYLRQRNCIGMVAESDNKIVGFMVYELHGSRLKIVNFAVHPDFQRRGVGAAMVRRLRDKLSNQRRKEIELKIRESNLSGQLFFKEQGFTARYVLKGCFDDTDEDAYFMRYDLPLDDQLPVNRTVQIEE